MIQKHCIHVTYTQAWVNDDKNVNSVNSDKRWKGFEGDLAFQILTTTPCHVHVNNIFKYDQT